MSVRGTGWVATLLLSLAAAPATAAPRCGPETARVDHVDGWQVRWPREWASLAAMPAAEQQRALLRWTAAPARLAEERAALRRDIATGNIAPAPVVRRILAQLDALLAKPLGPELESSSWRALLDESMRSGIEEHRDFLRRTYFPAAPPASGLAARPNRRACFEAAAARLNGIRRTVPEIEALGHRLLERYRKEVADLAGINRQEVSTELARLRNQDPKVSPEEILRVSRAAVARAQAALPRAFDVASPPPVRLAPVDEAVAVDVPAAFYERASGGAPATYRINLSRPSERRLMAEVIAFHETLPGHHLAFSANPSLDPAQAGLVEGWAIYAEHLAAELGLYSTREDLMGAATKHLWAASRLIVEPGLHVHGWSRDRAIAFMRDNTALSETEIEVEVDRYLAWPGQSLAYMVGHDTIERARRARQRCERVSFDLRRFHAQILASTTRSLADVERLAAIPCVKADRVAA